GTAADRVARRQLQLATAADGTDLQGDAQLHAVLELVERARRRVALAADQDAAEMPPDDPHLDLVARAHAVLGAAPVAQAAHGGEPVGLAQVRRRGEGLGGTDGKGHVGACLDHRRHGTTGMPAECRAQYIRVARLATGSNPSRSYTFRAATL